ncbi:MAG: PfkB family carbohydrate kinase [Bacteroidetes bacterium]|nr:PfkB family carbohydrate kinase [Bacteroidota bacterium]MCY4234269.1 PfkB family carbohydrate kinase [Bacteroidota bacterium]
MSILIVGTLALDTIETPTDKAEQVLGGSATYSAFAAHSFATPIAIVAVVGRDFPEQYHQILKSIKLDLSGVEISKEHDTFAWGCQYRDNLNIRDTTFTHLNALQHFSPVVPEAFNNCQVICLGNLHPQIQSDTLSQVGDASFVACDTMNYWIQETPAELIQVLKTVDCLVINDEEALQMTDEFNLFSAARKILYLGPKSLIIKKGEHGAMLFVEDQVFIIPSFPISKVKDPTGAGDAFLGAMAGSLNYERHIGLDALKRAVVYGSTVASFCVEHIGPYELLNLTQSDITKRAKQFNGVTEWPVLSVLSPLA